MVRMLAVLVVFAVIGGAAWFVLSAEPAPQLDLDLVGSVERVGGAVMGNDVAPVQQTGGGQTELSEPATAAKDSDPDDASVAGELPARIVGRAVFDASGGPVGGARVVAHLDEATRVEAEADADGRFVFAVEAPARLHALELIAAPGNAQHVATYDTALVSGVELDVELRVGATIVIRGRVIDDEGDPEPYATVRGWSLRPHVLDAGRVADTGVTVRADGAGRFTMTGLTSIFTIQAAADGLVAYERLFTMPGLSPSAIDDVVLRVSRERTVAGAVVTSDGSGVPGATVTARSRREAEPTDIASVMTGRPAPAVITTDARGGFELAPLWQEELEIVVDSNAYPQWRGLHEPGQAGMLIRLTMGARLAGIVRAASGAPSVGARVRFLPSAFGSGRVSRVTTTDERGEFAFDGLDEAREGVLDVLADEHAVFVRQGLAVSEGVEASRMDVQLRRERLLAGVVVDALGEPVPGARVRVEGERLLDMGNRTVYPLPTWESWHGVAETRTDRSGRFRLRHLDEGMYSVRVEDPDDGSLALTTSIAAGATDVRLVLDPANRRGVVFAGEVRDALTGQPIESFRVTAMIRQSNGGGAGPSEEFRGNDGRFVLSGIEPATIGLHVMAPGYADFMLQDARYDNGEHLFDIALRPERELHLRIMNMAGEPLEANVSFRDDAGEPLMVEVGAGSTGPWLVTDGDGEVRARRLPAARVTVVVSPTDVLVPTERVFDLTVPLEGRQDILVPDPITQDLLVLVFKPGPNARGAVSLLPATSSMNDRLVEIIGKLRDGELAAVANGVIVHLDDAEGTELGITPLDGSATEAVFSDASLVDGPVAVQIEVPVGDMRVRVTAPSHTTKTQPWSAVEAGAEELGLVVFVL